MRRIFYLLVCLLALTPSISYAIGGAQELDFTTGYSFRDVVNQTYASNYGWNAKQVVDPSRAVFTGATPASCNMYQAMKWQIQTGDDPLSNGSNRNEFYNMFGSLQHDETPSSGTQVYAMSVCIPSPWTEPQESTGFPWFIIVQLHGPDTNTAPADQANFQLLLTAGGHTARHFWFRTVGGDIASPTSHYTDLGPHVYDTEVDFVVQVTWAIDNTGHTTIWKKVVGTDADFVQMDDYNAPNLYSASGVAQTQVYMKHGIYRGDDLNAQGTANIYTGPFIRAPTLHDAKLGAFGHYP